MLGVIAFALDLQLNLTRCLICVNFISPLCAICVSSFTTELCPHPYHSVDLVCFTDIFHLMASCHLTQLIAIQREWLSDRLQTLLCGLRTDSQTSWFLLLSDQDMKGHLVFYLHTGAWVDGGGRRVGRGVTGGRPEYRIKIDQHFKSVTLKALHAAHSSTIWTQNQAVLPKGHDYSLFLRR